MSTKYDQGHKQNNVDKHSRVQRSFVREKAEGDSGCVAASGSAARKGARRISLIGRFFLLYLILLLWVWFDSWLDEWLPEQRAFYIQNLRQ
jgi:hypothetical protein